MARGGQPGGWGGRTEQTVLLLLPGPSGLTWVTENPKGTPGTVGSVFGYDKTI
jgi:hypothetical protein